MGVLRLETFMIQTITAWDGMERQVNKPVELVKGKHALPGATVAEFLIVGLI